MDENAVARLQDALFAYFDADDLSEFCRRLGTSRKNVTQINPTLRKFAEDLVEWAQNRELLDELAKLAVEERPGNAELQTIAQMLAEAQQSPHQLERIDLSSKLRQLVQGRPDVNSTLITWLINRVLQRDEVRRTVEEALGVGTPRPIACLLHGEDTECHDKFVQSIVRHQLESLLPIRDTTPQHIVLNLPPSYRSRADLHDFLRADMGDKTLRNMRAQVPEINERLTALRAPIVVETLMPVEEWKQSDHGVVHDYLGFWAGWPPLAAGQLLMIFLCIRSQPPARGLLARMPWKRQPRDIGAALNEFASTAESAQRFADLQSVRVTVLSELEPVTKQDAQKWALESNTQGYFAVSDLIGAIAEIFQRLGKDELPMATLHAEVAKLALRS